MRVLSLGATGPDVQELQNQLIKNGSPKEVKADGLFGAITRTAVKDFQFKHDLVPDGIVGKNTWNALTFGQGIPDLGMPRTLEQIDQEFSKGSVPWYEAAFRICEFDKGFEPIIRAAANHALKLKADYVWGEQNTGVPWIMLLGVHLLECGNNPRGVLHNGQLIVGTGRKTTIVPKGRGPFATFRESIIDAVKTQGLLNSIHPDAWTIGLILKQSEAFNGTGYLHYHPKENSPYLWAQTNINDGTGRYSSDSHWSENADTNKETGVAAVFKMLESMGEYQFKFSQN